MSIDSRVGIRLGADELRLCESYDIRIGVFDQPSSFSVNLPGISPSEQRRRYPKETPFQIAVEGREQFSGYTDGFHARGNEQSSSFGIHGRDVIKELIHSEIEKEADFKAPTHAELIRMAIAAVDLKRPFSTLPVAILTSNAENRRKVSGQSSLVVQDDSSEAALARIAGATGSRFPVLRTKLAETYFSLLRRHLDAVGLFLWCSASGDLVVGRPNHKQPASCAISRGRGKGAAVKEWEYSEDNTPRFSDVAIYGRTTGTRKTGKATAKGAYTDDELLAQGHRWVHVFRDGQVTSTAHAEHVARKKLAEGRRAGFNLTYTLAGHTTTSLLTGKQVCWATDTVVAVDDEYLGLKGNYWVEQVEFHRSSDRGTVTRVKLLEPDALIFGDDV